MPNDHIYPLDEIPAWARERATEPRTLFEQVRALVVQYGMQAVTRALLEAAASVPIGEAAND